MASGPCIFYGWNLSLSPSHFPELIPFTCRSTDWPAYLFIFFSSFAKRSNWMQKQHKPYVRTNVSWEISLRTLCRSRACASVARRCKLPMTQSGHPSSFMCGGWTKCIPTWKDCQACAQFLLMWTTKLSLRATASTHCTALKLNCRVWRSGMYLCLKCSCRHFNDITCFHRGNTSKFCPDFKLTNNYRCWIFTPSCCASSLAEPHLQPYLNKIW